MKMVTVRKIVGGLVVSGFGVACALTGTGPASAASSMLQSPLLNTTCSFGQIDRALHADRPDLAAKLDSRPQAKAQMQRLLNMPIPQRRAAVQQWMRQHPDQVARGRQWEAAHPGAMNQRIAYEAHLASICHNF